MRVIHVMPPLVNLGNGVLAAAMDLAIAQADAGLDVTVVAGPGCYEELLERHGICVVRQPSDVSPRSLLRARRLLARSAEHADVVHAHTLRALVTARTLRGTSALVFTAHNGRGRVPALMRLADGVICVSEADARTLAPVLGKKPFVVRNGTLGSPRYAAHENVGLPSRTILYTGGMYLRKGVDVLIRAFQEMGDPTAHLVLAGDGPDRGRFEDLASHGPLARNIRFVGFTPVPRSYMRECTIFCLPSRHEPFGLVAAEAREEGCAIVASDVGGIPEVLDGRGVLVPPDDPGRLAAALQTLLADDQMRLQLAAVAQADLDWLRIERVGKEVTDVYRSLGVGAQS